MKKAIIIGASSGIGRELAHLLAQDGVYLGLAARRLTRLEEFRKEYSNAVLIRQLDVSEPEATMRTLKDLIDEMGDVDLIVFSSGIGEFNSDLNWEPERNTIATNVLGFTAVSNVAVKFFLGQKYGHFVGLSSIAAISSKFPITITDVQPGFVDTKMAKGDGQFWVAPKEKAAKQIYQAIKNKKSHVYITKRWRLIAWILTILPDVIYNRV